MNRRTFMKAGMAVAATAVLPVLPVEAPATVLTLADLRRIINSLVDDLALQSQPYFMVHPVMYADMLRIDAEYRWKESYRTYRIGRRDDKWPEMTAQQISARQAPMEVLAGFKIIRNI